MFKNITTFQWILWGFSIAMTWGLAKKAKWAGKIAGKLVSKFINFIWEKITGGDDDK